MAANKQCVTRLQKEYKSLLKVRVLLCLQLTALCCESNARPACMTRRCGRLLHPLPVVCGVQEPVPNITAHPSPTNLLEWHFVLEGAKGTEYDGGVYHGKLV